ncbi:MAG: PfkB family carbohydrate kinase [Traorella sp.]
MKKTLFIGSTVLDMIVNVDHLPSSKEDINASDITLSIGGCAYNACQIVDYFNLESILCSPVGKGHFASLLKELMSQKGMKPFVELDNQDNGCCICLVDQDGERSFISIHGAEYRFDSKWLDHINCDDIDYIYVCGLELEDENGEQILDYLEHASAKIFFAPSGRISNIQKERMKRILALHPILHLNEDEISNFTHEETVSRAVESIFHMTHELVIVTCGERGAYYMNHKVGKLIPGYKTKVIDTIGAGDSHAGACLAGLKLGMPIDDIIMQANKIACKVVSVKGASITKEQFDEIIH